MKGFTKLIIGVCLVMGLVMPVLAADPGVTDTEILLGSSLPLESGPKNLGIETSHGLMAYINSVNDEGGVNGRKIKVIFYNDGYEPLSCVQNTQKLINEDKVFALTSYVGTPTSVKAQPVWTNAKVPLVGFFTGAEALRTPFNRYNIHIRGSYYQETAAAVDIFIKQLNLKKIAVFYQNDAFGEAVKKGTEIALEKYGMIPVVYGSFERNTLNIEEGLKKIVEVNPDVVVMVGTYSPLAKFVKEAKKAGLTKTFFYTVSFIGPETFLQELGQDTARVIVSQVVPPYEDPAYAQLPVVKKYLECLKKYYPGDSANFVGLEGFINGMVLVKGLELAGKNLTRENFIDAIELIKPGKVGTGLGLNYGSNDHVGMDRIYLTQIKGRSYIMVRN